MFVKTKCFDIFQDAKIGKQRIYEETCTEKILQFKYEMNNKLSQYYRLKLMVAFNTLTTINPLVSIQIKLK